MSSYKNNIQICIIHIAFTCTCFMSYFMSFLLIKVSKQISILGIDEEKYTMYMYFENNKNGTSRKYKNKQEGRIMMNLNPFGSFVIVIDVKLRRSTKQSALSMAVEHVILPQWASLTLGEIPTPFFWWKRAIKALISDRSMTSILSHRLSLLNFIWRAASTRHPTSDSFPEIFKQAKLVEMN